LKCGMIIDYLVENGNIACFRAIIRRAIIELVKTNCDAIVMWAFSDPIFDKELKKHFGFKSTAQFPVNKFFDNWYLDVWGLHDR